MWDLIRGDLHRIDGKFGADDLAIMTIYTLIRTFHAGRMIPLFVEFGRKFKHLLWTKLNTEPAPLAAVFQDVDLTTRYLDLFNVKGNPPECHYPFLKLGKKALLLI
jgi:hypothetical protein